MSALVNVAIADGLNTRLSAESSGSVLGDTGPAHADPTAPPALSLDFAGNKVLPSTVTFTRASTGTYYGADGLLKSAANDVARFDHDPATFASKGLLVEEQRTNLLTYSQEFDNAAWTASELLAFGSGSVVNATTGPDGTTTGDLIVPTTTSSAHTIRTASITLATTTKYAMSVYAKASGYLGLSFQFGTGVGAFAAFQQATFNLSTGAAAVTGGTGTASMTSVGNGWWRCEFTTDATTSSVAMPVYLKVLNASQQGTYAGDGTSGLYIWGAQIEAGAFPTSYIPTTTASATRSADVASMTGTNFSSWYNQTEGTFVVSANAYYRGRSNIVLDIGAGGAFGTTAYIVANNSAAVGAAPASAPVNMSSQVSWSGNTYSAAVGMQENNAVAAVNGVLGTVDTSCAMPANATQLIIGNGGWSLINTSAMHNGHISRITYYPKRLPNTTLQALSK